MSKTTFSSLEISPRSGFLNKYLRKYYRIIFRQINQLNYFIRHTAQKLFVSSKIYVLLYLFILVNDVSNSDGDPKCTKELRS